MIMLTVCSSMLINYFTGLHEHNVYDICFIGLMDHTHCETLLLLSWTSKNSCLASTVLVVKVPYFTSFFI